MKCNCSREIILNRFPARSIKSKFLITYYLTILRNGLITEPPAQRKGGKLSEQKIGKSKI